MKELILKIDWSELDLYGHVNNVMFFRYVQSARIRFCESIGLSSMNEPGKHSFIVASSECNYRKPLKYPGEISIRTLLAWTKNSSFRLEYTIFNNQGEITADAADVIVLYDYETESKITIPDELKKLMEVAGKITE